MPAILGNLWRRELAPIEVLIKLPACCNRDAFKLTSALCHFILLEAGEPAFTAWQGAVEDVLQIELARENDEKHLDDEVLCLDSG